MHSSRVKKNLILYRNWHPFASIPFLIFIPLPVIIGKQFSQNSLFEDDSSPAMECAYFISASLFTTSVILPFFFYQLGYVVNKYFLFRKI
jgi:hypothetical protein